MSNILPELDTNNNSQLSIGIDYFRAVMWFPSKEALQQGIGQLAINNPYLLKDDTPWGAGPGATRYPNSVHTAVGIRGGYGEREANDGSTYWELMLDYSGEYCQRLTIVDYTQLCMMIKHDYQGRCTRLDIKIDDWQENVIPVDEMVQAFHDGNNALFRKHKTISDERWEKGQIVADVTHYFGSRNSGKMVRIYRHWHDHIKDYSLRYEAEFKRGRCNEIFDMLADFDWQKNYRIHQEVEDVESSIAQALGAYALGALDFVNKSEKDWEVVNYQNCQRLPFWQKFIDAIGGYLRIRPPVQTTSLTDRMEWFKRQCSKTLRIFQQGLGTDLFRCYVYSLFDDADKRWTSDDDLMAQQLKQDRKRKFQLPFTVGEYSPTVAFYAY